MANFPLARDLVNGDNGFLLTCEWEKRGSQFLVNIYCTFTIYTSF